MGQSGSSGTGIFGTGTLGSPGGKGKPKLDAGSGIPIEKLRSGMGTFGTGTLGSPGGKGKPKLGAASGIPIEKLRSGMGTCGIGIDGSPGGNCTWSGTLGKSHTLVVA